MMPATEKEVIRDYIERTKLNYERLKAGPYEVTQLINSAIGLLIIPEQKLYDKITNKMISKQLLNELIVHIQIKSVAYLTIYVILYSEYIQTIYLYYLIR